MVKPLPGRILLDTNVFIIGLLDESSPEGQVLTRLRTPSGVVVLLSNELEEQLRRVGRRVADKDWAGMLLYLIWRDYTIEYVEVPQALMHELEQSGDIPKEDIGIYLTALLGEAECFVSSNRELVQEAAAKQSLFECLTPEEFLTAYFSKVP
jgi:predicted nucleic acid-binding protein